MVITFDDIETTEKYRKHVYHSLIVRGDGIRSISIRSEERYCLAFVTAIIGF